MDTAHAVYRELATAQERFVLSNDLHMLYLCIPLEVVSSIDPNWRIFFDKVCGKLCHRMLMTSSYADDIIMTVGD